MSINKEILETVVTMKDEVSKTISKIEKEFDKLNKKISELPKNTKPSGEGMEGLQKSLTGLNRAIKGFLALKVVSIAKDFTKFTLDASSNMQELENITTQVFDKMSNDIEKFAKNAGASMGRSIYDMKKYTSEMGAVLKGIGGFETSQIKDMSQALATLAVDIGSFKNIDDSQAFNALRGGIVGETESLKQLGIVINDTVMKEYALKQGIKRKLGDFRYNIKSTVKISSNNGKNIVYAG